MKNIIRKFLYAIYYLRWCKKVKINGNNIVFSKSSKINLLQGSNKENIVLDDNVKVYGTLSICKDGFISMGKFSQIGPGSIIRCVNKVTIGDYTSISTNVVISDNNSHPVNPKDRIIMQQTASGARERNWIFSDNAPIEIGQNCWIGENARICKGVTIGEGSIIAANAVVTKSVPSNSIAAGNPAKIVKSDIDRVSRYFGDD